MRKIRERLRVKFDLDLSIHKIAASLSIARSTVTEYLRRAAAAGVAWPLPPEMDDGQLEAQLLSTTRTPQIGARCRKIATAKRPTIMRSRKSPQEPAFARHLMALARESTTQLGRHIRIWQTKRNGNATRAGKKNGVRQYIASMGYR